MATMIIGNPARVVKPQTSPAGQMPPTDRKKLALQGIARTEPLTELARENEVSRKFIYSQIDKAEEALDNAFSDQGEKTKENVLFFLPVTKRWIRSFVLSLVLSCHAPYRGISEVLRELFDFPLSPASIHNFVYQAVEVAREVNDKEDLSNVRVGAHDEIFQAGKPVLAGVDVDSLYCYLLSLEDHRDANTWGVHLLDLEAKGLQPDYTVNDAGKGLRAGQAEAWPGVACHGDVFHALRALGQVAVYTENRAFGAITARDKLERKMEQSKKRSRGKSLSKKLGSARSAENSAIQLADDMAILATWLREDVLALVGPDYQERSELYDFIVDSLKEREALLPHRISPVRRFLENQRSSLLAFAAIIDKRLGDISKSFHVPLALVRSVYELHGLGDTNQHYQRESELRSRLGSLFYPVDMEVRAVLSDVVRASSAVENFNSRLRDYFFLRQQLGAPYLDLLRFYLNHHRFARSERPEREGKSPAEILTGQTLPHWLDRLGFDRYRRTAA